jgi:DNA adenine methylase
MDSNLQKSTTVLAPGSVAVETVRSGSGARPILKWCGGKRKLVSQIRALMPEHFTGRYWEPFLGGGAVFFSLTEAERKGAFLSDMNAPLIATYQALQDPALLRDVLDELQGSRYANEEKAYYAVREDNFVKGNAARRAADFLYCNKIGFNGLFRTNLAGKFNVPFGRYREMTFDEENLELAGSALRGVTVERVEYLSIEPAKGDVVYFDPPYLPLSVTSSFTAYTPGGFDEKDHERLAAFALGLKRRGVHVVLSNSAAPLIRDLYSREKDWEMIEVLAARSVNSKVLGRGKVSEFLIR